MVIHADTSFLVDLLRESRRASAGPATTLLAALASVEIRKHFERVPGLTVRTY
ncbi:MAG: hypothetical protein SF182_25480 [Deltaproteobacteria bacterium]|nr:hypothetical protein [Deltaproteobacteria bacterium]